MAEPSSVASLRAYYKVPVQTINVEEMYHLLQSESDRTALVVLGSVLEDTLGQVMRARLRPMDQRTEQSLRLFDYDGPFGSFSKRISVAYAWSLIDEFTRADLLDFRELRNACAHSFKPIDLDTPQLNAVCMRLFMEERPGMTIKDDPITRETLREALWFKFTLVFMTIILGSLEDAQRALIQMALADGVQPGPLFDKPQPQSIPQDRENQTAQTQPPPPPASQASARKNRPGKRARARAKNPKSTA